MCGITQLRIIREQYSLINKGDLMEKIAIMTDTGSAITPQEAKDAGLYLLPLQIGEAGKSYLDQVDLSTQDVYTMLKAGKMPTTSMPVYITIEETLQKIKDSGYDSVIVVPLTAGLSSTSDTITSIAQELDIPMTTIDCFATCHIQKHIVYQVKTLVDQGKSREEIKSIMAPIIKDAYTVIVPFNLQHLKRGGRLTPLAASLAGLLKIVPLLHIGELTNGKIDMLDKVRTKTRALKMQIEKAIAQPVDQNESFYILNSDAREDAEILKQGLIEKGISESFIKIVDINPVIACHTGLQCVVIQRVKNL